MSHFTVAVLHREDQDVDELLAPYDESIEVAPYVKYTRQQAIDRVHSWKGHEDMPDDEAYQYLAEDYETDEDGNLLTTYNPNSKWDWYEIGGRWDGELRLKNGESSNEARISEIDFSPNDEDYEEAIKDWENEFNGWYNMDHLKQMYGTAEVYAKTVSAFSTYAVVTPDGVWHQKAEMGWFGMDNATPEDSKNWPLNYYDRFIKNADPNLIMTIVDCHI